MLVLFLPKKKKKGCDFEYVFFKIKLFFFLKILFVLCTFNFVCLVWFIKSMIQKYTKMQVMHFFKKSFQIVLYFLKFFFLNFFFAFSDSVDIQIAFLCFCFSQHFHFSVILTDLPERWSIFLVQTLGVDQWAGSTPAEADVNPGRSGGRAE